VFTIIILYDGHVDVFFGLSSPAALAVAQSQSWEPGYFENRPDPTHRCMEN
jgi:hypothetical protein